MCSGKLPQGQGHDLFPVPPELVLHICLVLLCPGLDLNVAHSTHTRHIHPYTQT